MNWKYFVRSKVENRFYKSLVCVLLIVSSELWINDPLQVKVFPKQTARKVQKTFQPHFQGNNSTYERILEFLVYQPSSNGHMTSQGWKSFHNEYKQLKWIFITPAENHIHHFCCFRKYFSNQRVDQSLSHAINIKGDRAGQCKKIMWT